MSRSSVGGVGAPGMVRDEQGYRATAGHGPAVRDGAARHAYHLEARAGGGMAGTTRVDAVRRCAILCVLYEREKS